MKRIVHIAKGYDEARRWDIKQAAGMSCEERQQVAAELKRKAFGSSPDIKEWHNSEKA